MAQPDRIALPAALAAVRVVAITDVALLGDDPRAAFARAVAGCAPGSVLIQIRAKHLDGAAVLSLARIAADAAPTMPLAINDRVDVALATPGAGVHLPEDGLSIAAARSLGIQSLAIGVSRHTYADAGDAAEAGADLVQLGPIWDTPGKGAALGTNAIASARHRIDVADRPAGRAGAILVAVGGVDSPDRAREAVLAGAHAVALVRAAWTGESLRPFVTAVDDALAFREMRAER